MTRLKITDEEKHRTYRKADGMEVEWGEGVLVPSANDLLEHFGEPRREGGDEVRLPLSTGFAEDETVLRQYVASRVHLLIDLHQLKEAGVEKGIRDRYVEAVTVGLWGRS